jgi:hypothetical protein
LKPLDGLISSKIHKCTNSIQSPTLHTIWGGLIPKQVSKPSVALRPFDFFHVNIVIAAIRYYSTRFQFLAHDSHKAEMC